MTATKTQTAEPQTAEQTPTAPHVSHNSIDAALAAFQAEIPSVAKLREVTVDGDHGPEVIRVADLATITERTMPILGKHGLSFAALPTSVDGEGFVLQYRLTHEGGEYLEGTYPLPDPALFDGQDVGAAITRARRFTLCAVTGVAPGGEVIDTPRATPAAQAWEPSRDWVAEVGTVIDEPTYRVLWSEAREAVKTLDAPRSILDAMAAAWRKRQAEQVTETDGEAAA